MLIVNGVAAVIAKLAGAGVATQATAGLGIALAGVTGAGAAGVLPDTVQEQVADAIETVTPFEAPRPVDDPGPGGASSDDDDADGGRFDRPFDGREGPSRR